MKKPIKKDHPYFVQAKLMLELIPAVSSEECFALKGGTAINFFGRDMPRLSVDIDLTYLPIEDRKTSLGKISEALKRITSRIKASHPHATIQEGLVKDTKLVCKLYVTDSRTQVIIEPNLTLRGTLFQTEKRTISPKVQDAFELSTSILTVSKADLYGGKLCAALDRQHPRDLFDVKILLENEGITDEIRKGFIVYLSSHDETMSQLLDPPRKDIAATYRDEFAGMPMEPVTLEELLSVREKLFCTLRKSLTQDERQFLLSIKEASPKWALLGVTGADKLPAIQWKLMNVKKMSDSHHRKSIERLRTILEI